MEKEKNNSKTIKSNEKDLNIKEIKKKLEIGNKEIKVEKSKDLIKIPNQTLKLVTDLKEEKEKPIKIDKSKVVVTRYNPDPNKGLSEEEALYRKILKMDNKPSKKVSKSYFSIFVSNVCTLFNLIMVLLFIWLLTVGEKKITNYIFIGTVLLNIFIGIFQEIKAKKVITKLTILQEPITTIVRDGVEKEKKSQDIVLDDILILTQGKQIPADCVLVSDTAVEVNESLLTGESDPILKRKGDPLNSGSFIISGVAKAQVVAVGNDIYIEKLSNQAKKYQKPKSQLLRSLKILIFILTILIIPIGILLGYFSFSGIENFSFKSPEYILNVPKIAGAMIGMVPSGLFLLTSMALAVGVIRLAEKKTLVQNIYCIEMLARVDVLCLDKTGTITDGSMSVISVQEFKTQSNVSSQHVISTLISLEKSLNPTSQALLDRFGKDEIYKPIDTISFSSSRKYQAVELEKIGTFYLGAPEFILSKEKLQTIKPIIEKAAMEGHRVLLLAFAKGSLKTVDQQQNVIWPQLIISIQDTIRHDAKDTIEYFYKSGVDVKVISGDNPLTVSRIAERAGIKGYNKYISLENVEDQEIESICEKYTVFGRVTPKQKKLLVQALKKKKHTVAMTGDGVNDILALKEADTSIAMASGSDAARKVSHLVLLNSNFSVMPSIVAEGRRVINNVQKVSTLFLTKTIFSILLAIITIFFLIKNTGQGLSFPLSSGQYMPIDILAIGIPAFFLALEYNNNKIETGNFLKNIIKSALPGALAIIFMVIVIYVFKDTLGINDHTKISTLILICATTISLIVLLRTTMPLNPARRILVLAMISIFILAILFTPEFFQLSPIYKFKNAYYDSNKSSLTAVELLFLLVLLQASFPIIFITSNMFKWINKGKNTVLDFFKNYAKDEEIKK